MTTTPVAGLSAAAGAGEEGAKRRSRGAIAFVIGFALAFALTAFATLFAVSGVGGGVIKPGSSVLLWLLIASLVISMGLAAIIVHRIVRLLRGHYSAIPGARLHLKFVAMFSLAALAPAVVVAVFMGAALTQGVENWFRERVKTTVESSAGVGRYLVDGVRDTLIEDVRLMASDLNLAAGGLRSDPERYRRFLAEQAEGRFMVAAYIVDRSGAVLARAESQEAPAFLAPASDMFAEAASGESTHRIFERESMIRALVRLTAYRDAYLYVVRAVDPSLLRVTRAFDDSVAAYREAESRQREIGILIVLSYVSTAALVLLGAMWLGLLSATGISEPIGRLSAAARRVASGDLSARVAVRQETDEVDALGVAFNQMTAQLESQRAETLSARKEAETRSRFTQAVLGGVTAGVIGLDRDGRITSANRYAGLLLGLGDMELEGRRLVDVAPEFSDLLNEPTPHGETPPHRVELERENAPGELSVRMSPVADGGGLVLTFDDMTKVIAVQRQEAWKDVARRIAHEIKNPLTPIQLSAERLRRKYTDEIKSDPEIFQRCLDTILRQVSDIGRMVDEFTSFARMPAPRMAFADMSEIARAAVFSQRLANSDVRFEAEGVERPIPLVCDERLISQALTNVLKNAAESVQGRRQRDGEPKDGWVVLRLRDLETGVQFEIIDNGLGFPAHDRERLLEPYVTTRTKGTGLGLAIVSRIVLDHTGEIELADAPNPPGAVVRFVLPKRSEAPADAEAEIGEGAL